MTIEKGKKRAQISNTKKENKILQMLQKFKKRGYEQLDANSFES